jgi:hypothetical protein
MLIRLLPCCCCGRLDLGTADELALDVLLNMLVGFSADAAGIKSIQIGGDNESWPAPAQEEEFEGGKMPRVSPWGVLRGKGGESGLLQGRLGLYATSKLFWGSMFGEGQSSSSHTSLRAYRGKTHRTG